jgi:branched-chain amino acid transport system substrate-binding protein
MKRKLLCSLIAGLGLVVGGTAQAAISGGVVKVGVLSDMSGPYADLSVPVRWSPPRWRSKTISSKPAPS